MRAAGVASDEARLEAEVLLRHAAGLSREELFTRPEGVLRPRCARAFAALIDRRAAGCPTAYLVGHREFFGIDLLVDERVLIPRPETERLVDVARDALRGRTAPLAVDIGTGSGAIAIALARVLPALR
ncbi:MAG TPA: protein-(glutamine-N5) methyltransferase, release factor-specific, partial [bacterium]|nr:protein-(glutamine-N5) methyltransferase, release factor-specific [bacterium]